MHARKGRPVVRLPLSPLEIGIEVVALVSIALSIYLTVQAWATLPARIPGHFNLAGQPDAYANKSDLLYYPIFSAIAYIFMTLLSRIPQFFNYPWAITEENAARQYRLARGLINWLKLLLIWILVYAEWLTIEVATKQATGPGALGFIGLVLCMLLSTAVYIVVARRAR
ncbi:MAG: DUF1648 domain-containing protein [Thermogemmatispora sp.]|jgi:uncharacterized membrane protein|uniref:DUF1648 domain-containing protein n=1 Tax=Thermogemmatispora sp. TaxID=1968838 RepID=UPI0019E2BC2A|nr:DUF1648 domain-containing protein [Thermogemmatispora sp.]MBE3565073.1 DUF1648 domain-containing protein [Thermogemmatispora sp.]